MKTFLRYLVLSAAPAAMHFASSAQAQQAEVPPVSVDSIRLLGEWRTEIGTLSIRRNGPGQYLALVFPENSDRQSYFAHLAPAGDGKSVAGELYADSNSRKIGLARVAFDPASKNIVLSLEGEATVDGRRRLTGRLAQNETWIERDFKYLFGTWNTTFGTLTLAPEGAHIVGTVERRATDEHPGGTTVVALAPENGDHRMVDGAWTTAGSAPQRGLLNWNGFGRQNNVYIGGTYTSSWFANAGRRDYWVADRAPSGGALASAPWVGQYLSEYGKYRFVTFVRPDGDNLLVESFYTDGQRVPRGSGGMSFGVLNAASGARTLQVAKGGGGGSMTAQGGEITLSPDGKRITARLCDWESTCVPFSASRLTPASAEATPAPEQPTPPVVTPPAPPPVVTPPPPPPPGPVVASFKPLNRVDVRLDRLVEARGYPTRQVHAFVTIKNASPSPQYFTSGFVKAALADADGATWERSQPYRASGEPAALFASTPVIQPGGELKVRYVYNLDEGVMPTTVTLSEGAKHAEFPVNGL